MFASSSSIIVQLTEKINVFCVVKIKSALMLAAVKGFNTASFTQPPPTTPHVPTKRFRMSRLPSPFYCSDSVQVPALLCPAFVNRRGHN